MGEDGHFASLFPDSPELMTGLTGDTDVISVTTPSSPYSRTSMTLRSITKTRAPCLLVFGETKRVAEEPAGLRHQSSAGSDAGRNFLGTLKTALRQRQADQL